MNMDEDDDMYMSDSEEYMPDIESCAESDDENRNVKEMEMLLDEINHIIGYGAEPPELWYIKRHNNIQIYSELNWLIFAQRFEQIDRYIHNIALNIINNIEDLMEEFDKKRQFDIRNFQHLIRDIHDLWNYYKTAYIGEESDPEIGDLIVGLSHILSNL